MDDSISVDETISRMRRASSINKPINNVDLYDAKKPNHTEIIKRLDIKTASSRLGLSSKSLLKILRERNYFTKVLNDNLPRPELIEKGYFQNEIREFKRGDIKNNYIKVYVTANGMSFLANLIDLSNKNYLKMEME